MPTWSILPHILFWPTSSPSFFACSNLAIFSKRVICRYSGVLYISRSPLVASKAWSLARASTAAGPSSQTSAGMATWRFCILISASCATASLLDRDCAKAIQSSQPIRPTLSGLLICTGSMVSPSPSLAMRMRSSGSHMRLPKWRLHLVGSACRSPHVFPSPPGVTLALSRTAGSGSATSVDHSLFSALQWYISESPMIAYTNTILSLHPCGSALNAQNSAAVVDPVSASSHSLRCDLTMAFLSISPTSRALGVPMWGTEAAFVAHSMYCRLASARATSAAHLAPHP
mmetsp:Transcript_22659/g.70364  ORF Transcript_22659/g.70364 Transcript_22659/m.70364 type:complete len:287 (+) Transcript_22659:488-1348(+)